MYIQRRPIFAVGRVIIAKNHEDTKKATKFFVALKRGEAEKANKNFSTLAEYVKYYCQYLKDNNGMTLSQLLKR
ncbi:MAG: hypothetical protein KR126chlam6_00952 [Candidatus Anoxychlamydiales bacterium]|nr:hypothetical protein [Candidatus Anoxychlamydiales bacterium]